MTPYYLPNSKKALASWTDKPGSASGSQRHLVMRGPLLELCAETASKEVVKNGLHLDIGLEIGDHPEEIAAGIVARDGREREPKWRGLQGKDYGDPSGNEFCVLPAILRHTWTSLDVSVNGGVSSSGAASIKLLQADQTMRLRATVLQTRLGYPIRS